MSSRQLETSLVALCISRSPELAPLLQAKGSPSDHWQPQVVRAAAFGIVTQVSKAPTPERTKRVLPEAHLPKQVYDGETEQHNKRIRQLILSERREATLAVIAAVGVLVHLGMILRNVLNRKYVMCIRTFLPY